jgi:hypothetical protein
MKYREPIDLDIYREPLLAILRAVIEQPKLPRKEFEQVLKQHLKDNRDFFRACRETWPATV